MPCSGSLDLRTEYIEVGPYLLEIKRVAKKTGWKIFELRHGTRDGGNQAPRRPHHPYDPPWRNFGMQQDTRYEEPLGKALHCEDL
jgi:hypothetical protein